MSQAVSPPEPEKLLRVDEVSRLVGMSPRHIWRLVALDRFPQPIRIGGRCQRWPASEIEAYIKHLASLPKKTPKGVNVFDLSQYGG